MPALPPQRKRLNLFHDYRGANGIETRLVQIGRASSSDQWPQYLLGTKYVPLKRFPYFIVYRELGDELQVVAIAHSKRRRGYWRKRVL